MDELLDRLIARWRSCEHEHRVLPVLLMCALGLAVTLALALSLGVSALA